MSVDNNSIYKALKMHSDESPHVVITNSKNIVTSLVLIILFCSACFITIAFKYGTANEKLMSIEKIIEDNKKTMPYGVVIEKIKTIEDAVFINDIYVKQQEDSRNAKN